MNVRTLLMTASAALVFAAPAMAQTSAAANATVTSEDQRNVNQQDRIESGLKSGQLNAHETAKLENGEARIDRTEARDEKNGTLTAAEKARIQTLQNKESTAIYDQKHDAQTGNPASASSQRLQGDVQRDANQEKRIENGQASGQLTAREAARDQRGEARVDAAQSRDAKVNGVNAREQRRLTRKENRASGRIYHAKHNGATGVQ